MTITLIGQVAHPVGWCAQRDRAGDVDTFQLPASGFKQLQPKPLPILFDHDPDWELGEVRYLERSAPDGLLAVAVLDADVADLLADGPWYLSARCRTYRLDPFTRGNATMSELSLVRHPASRG